MGNSESFEEDSFQSSGGRIGLQLAHMSSPTPSSLVGGSAVTASALCTRFYAPITMKITSGYSSSSVYTWDWGDGSGTSSSMASPFAGHVYDTPGIYTVKISDGKGSTGSMSIDVWSSMTHS